MAGAAAALADLVAALAVQAAEALEASVEAVILAEAARVRVGKSEPPAVAGGQDRRATEFKRRNNE